MKQENPLDLELYDFFIDKLLKKEPFSFVRYGDGEWGLILKAEPMCTNHLLVTGEIMKKILANSPDYYVGLQPLAVRHWEKEIMEFLPPGIKLSNSDVFHRKSIRGHLDSFFESLKGREVIVVGPSHLRKANMFKYQFVETPDIDVWNVLDKIEKNLLNVVDVEKEPVILYSCSVAAKIIIDRMYNIFKEKITQIDTGSLLDPYVGMNSRTYHKIVIDRLNIPEDKVIQPRKK